VRELYEYDAPRFGHRQNLVALHKGNLGVGVAHPTSRFEVAGADGLQEYPPKAMTDYETYIEGHGVFRAYANSEQNGAAWKAFNKTDATGEGWVTDIDEFVADTGYSNTSTATTNTIFGRCSFLAIETPGLIKLEKIRIQPDVNTSGAPDAHDLGMPKDFQIWARKGATEWTQIAGYTDQIFLYLTGSTEYYDVNANDYYSEFAIVVTRTHTSSSYSWTSGTSQYTRGSIGEWRLFGTPAPSSLEDGHLSLGKALTLPRVSGHPAGAETPRAESLVVHYDTTVDSVASGTTVVDISGEGSNGTLTNGAAYSSTDRAFTFDGVNDFIEARCPFTTGTDLSFSASMWIKFTTIYSNTYDAIFEIGSRDDSTSAGSSISAFVYHGSSIGFYTNFLGTSTVNTGFLPVVNRWYHLLHSYDKVASTLTTYIDGDFVKSSSFTDNLNLTANSILRIAADSRKASPSNHNNATYSNFKLWNVALTAEEVAMEYALGRTGKSLNLTDTALCLGGTVPRAQLDVRGGARFGNRVDIGTNTGTSDFNPTALTIHEISNSKTTPALTLNRATFDAVYGSSWQLIDVTTDNLINRVRQCSVNLINYNTVGSGQANFSGRRYTGMGFSVSNAQSGIQENALAIRYDGNVGIGKTNPTCLLDLTNRVENRIISLYNGSSSSDTAYYGFGINSGTLRYNVEGTTSIHKFYGNSTEFGYVNNANGFVNSFTGQHKSFPHESLFGKKSEDLCGLIVSASGEYISINDKVPQKGQGAIQVSEAIPTVKLSTSEKDKKVFGVISDVEDVETSQRHDHYGAFVSTFEKEPGDSRIYVNSIGEGAMWVVNTAGPLESGDYITTSNVAGYGQRQESEFLANYTVAKITMDCDFNPPDIPVQRILKELSNVNYWVKTTYSNVTPEEYSNLAEENRTTEDETYYTRDVERKFTYKPTMTVTADDAWDDVSIFPSDVTYAEWSNLEANVQNTYTLTYTQNDYESMRYEKTTVSNVTAEDAWDSVHIEPPMVTYAEYSNLEANVQNTYTVTYTNSTTTSVTAEEYNNLEANVQGEYTLVYLKIVTEEVTDPEGADEHTRTIYKKIEREETKNEPTEDTGEWGLDIRQEPVNALDEHGQLQWEDDPSGATEKAYKIRYIDATGQQTDEANCVHRAAFVGCTYHCG
jgi:hypothetical protein